MNKIFKIIVIVIYLSVLPFFVSIAHSAKTLECSIMWMDHNSEWSGIEGIFKLDNETLYLRRSGWQKATGFYNDGTYTFYMLGANDMKYAIIIDFEFETIKVVGGVSGTCRPK